jgi:hypothetical protein
MIKLRTKRLFAASAAMSEGGLGALDLCCAEVWIRNKLDQSSLNAILDFAECAE